MRVLRFENEAEDLLHYLKESGLHPGLGHARERRQRRDPARRFRDYASVTRSVAEGGVGGGGPSPPPRVALPDQLVLGKERYGR